MKNPAPLTTPPTVLLQRNLSRRAALAQASAASLALPFVMAPMLPAWAQAPAKPRVPTPAQSEGPFYPDQALADADFDLLQNGNQAYAKGQSAWVSGVVSDLAGQPVSGAVVEIWQCDHDGTYRHSRSSGQAPMAFQGFGKVQVGADGRYRFRTIKPVPYPGRPPHIHIKVKLGSRELLTTQMYVAGEQTNGRDFLVRGLRTEERSLLEATFSRASEGWQAEFGLVVRA